ncbi:hypothetical protein [Niallia sp. BSM11]|uniref:hypothetical protein n=1 Tax=Niallia sp. BSM11 TaxID=3391576 RepID=UPI0039851A13
MFVLTSAIFKQGKKGVYAFPFFAEDFSRLDILWLKNVYLDFLRRFLEDSPFREKVINEFQDNNKLYKEKITR